VSRLARPRTSKWRLEPHGRLQFENPDVAESSDVPPTTNVPEVLVFRLLT
jgi:hypothetical protein